MNDFQDSLHTENIQFLIFLNKDRIDKVNYINLNSNMRLFVIITKYNKTNNLYYLQIS